MSVLGRDAFLLLTAAPGTLRVWLCYVRQPAACVLVLAAVLGACSCSDLVCAARVLFAARSWWSHSCSHVAGVMAAEATGARGGGLTADGG